MALNGILGLFDSQTSYVDPAIASQADRAVWSNKMFPSGLLQSSKLNQAHRHLWVLQHSTKMFGNCHLGVVDSQSRQGKHAVGVAQIDRTFWSDSIYPGDRLIRQSVRG